MHYVYLQVDDFEVYLLEGKAWRFLVLDEFE